MARVTVLCRNVVEAEAFAAGVQWAGMEDLHFLEITHTATRDDGRIPVVFSDEDFDETIPEIELYIENVHPRAPSAWREHRAAQVLQ